jgi:UDP-2-acetamido-3-amino-2,3-dideoxy-glucuronate N-acetyltransferase
MSETLPRVTVVGAGYWGPNLIRNFHELGALASVCDLDTAKLNAICERFGKLETTTDLDGVLADPSIEAIAIATPAQTHHALAMRALKAGKHVMVEKPLTLDVAESEELVATAQELNRILMVGHIQQFNPAAEALLKLVTDGTLGEIVHVEMRRLDLGKLRSHENVFWSFAPHDIAYVLSLAGGAYPQSVSAHGAAILQPGIHDTVHADLRFAGFSAHIHVSWLHPEKQHQTVVVGTKQMAIFSDTWPEGRLWYGDEPLAQGKLKLIDKGYDLKDGKHQIRSGGETLVPYRPAEPLKAELRHFLQCIRTGERPRTDGQTGLNVVKILSAVDAALAQSGT